jgi:hypothetical protein
MAPSSLVGSATATWPRLRPRCWQKALTRWASAAPSRRAPRRVVPSTAMPSSQHITLRCQATRTSCSQVLGTASKAATSTLCSRRFRVARLGPPRRTNPSRRSRGHPACWPQRARARRLLAPLSRATAISPSNAVQGCRRPRAWRGSGTWASTAQSEGAVSSMGALRGNGPIHPSLSEAPTRPGTPHRVGL